MRPRSEPKLPPGAFGNWIMVLPTPRLIASEASLGMLAAALRREVAAAARSFYTECAWLWQQEQEQQQALKVVVRATDMFDPDGAVVFTNWDWEQEDAEFGCKPVWVQGSGTALAPHCLIAQKELGQGGGVWVYVCLHTAPMQRFLEAVLRV